MKTEEKAKPLKGELFLLDEMGMDCGTWTFQDEAFITPNTTYFSCTKCGLVWDKSKELEEDILRKQTPSGPLALSYCKPAEHTFTLLMPFLWSWEGTHVLADGDILTIFDKNNPSKKIWSDTIKLKNYKSIHYSSNRRWSIETKPKGIKRKHWTKWFVESYPAELTPAAKKKK